MKAVVTWVGSQEPYGLLHGLVPFDLRRIRFQKTKACLGSMGPVDFRQETVLQGFQVHF